MADQDGRHSEMITQLLRHVTSSPHEAVVKGDIFRHTIYTLSLVVIDLRKSTRLSTSTTFRTVSAYSRSSNSTPILFLKPSPLLISNRDKQHLWERDWFEIRNSYSYTISYSYSNLKLTTFGVTEGGEIDPPPPPVVEDQKNPCLK